MAFTSPEAWGQTVRVGRFCVGKPTSPKRQDFVAFILPSVLGGGAGLWPFRTVGPGRGQRQTGKTTQPFRARAGSSSTGFRGRHRGRGGRKKTRPGRCGRALASGGKRRLTAAVLLTWSRRCWPRGVAAGASSVEGRVGKPRGRFSGASLTHLYRAPVSRPARTMGGRRRTDRNVEGHGRIIGPAQQDGRFSGPNRSLVRISVCRQLLRSPESRKRGARRTRALTRSGFAFRTSVAGSLSVAAQTHVGRPAALRGSDAVPISAGSAPVDQWARVGFFAQRFAIHCGSVIGQKKNRGSEAPRPLNRGFVKHDIRARC